MKLPEHVGNFPAVRFSRFLKGRGVQILPTGNNEVLRVYFNDSLQILHKDDKGKINWQGCDHLVRAYQAYRLGFPNEMWIENMRNEGTVKLGAQALRAIVDRDGCKCFYCGSKLIPKDGTIEHMLSRAHGGSNHISNLVLACLPCNKEAGHLSVSEKVRMRERLHDKP